ncbi:neutral zinc metallopeptidase [Herbidospora galbida]|uniref:neutral zinc metallopeptidase n=1 Tax=Herbidospora galbida TaxID=2575442 RepID=UPI001484D657|nr:neutral zinc metallopeptidase [Herbidospora galbida]
MRRILLSVLVLCLVTAAPAYADPSRDHRLTDNPLYAAGPIPRSSCAEKPIGRPNHVPTARKYVTFVLGCLDRVWSRQLAKAGVTYKKPRIRILDKDPKSYCGQDFWEPDRFFSLYCEDRREIMIVLDRTLLSRNPDDLYIFTLLAHHYAEHVQYLTGIEQAMYQHDEKDRPELWEYFRRFYLQSACLSGAFTGSVYRSMPRDAADWKAVVRVKGKEQNIYYGSAKDISYWMNRGFTLRNPEHCNTWTAMNSLVAGPYYPS